MKNDRSYNVKKNEKKKILDRPLLLAAQQRLTGSILVLSFMEISCVILLANQQSTN